MKRTLWRTLETTCLLTAASLVIACSDSSDPSGDVEPVNPSAEVTKQTIAVTEGKGIADSTLTAADDVAYLTQIGLMRGHLWVGHELFKSGRADMSATHMKHPKAELYSTLTDAFAARGVPGFAQELQALADIVEANADAAEEQASYDALLTAITTNEQGADTRSSRVIGEVIIGLLRTAADEYAIGIKDGRVNNLHEYQDALGFTRIAQQWAKSAAFTSDTSAAAAAARIQQLLSDLDVMWPQLAPEGALDFKAAQLFGAAARVEIEALGL